MSRATVSRDLAFYTLASAQEAQRLHLARRQGLYKADRAYNRLRAAEDVAVALHHYLKLLPAGDDALAKLKASIQADIAPPLPGIDAAGASVDTMCPACIGGDGQPLEGGGLQCPACHFCWTSEMA